MTPALHCRPAAPASADAQGAPSARAARTAWRIEWPVSAAALAGTALAQHAAEVGPDEPALLTWTVEFSASGSAAATAELSLGAGRVTLVERTAATIAGDREGHTHVIIPGHLSAVVDAPAHGPARLLYGATQWLARLNIPGGRADRPRLHAGATAEAGA